MKEKTVELELRARVLLREIKDVKKRLERLGVFHSHTRRLSVMYFGAIGSKKIDIRVRITNGECEVVIKSGSFGAHDRMEFSQTISYQQFLGFVKLFTQFGFASKIGERETFNYKLPGGIISSLVIAGSVAYLEIEKMSSQKNVEKNIRQLTKIADSLGLQLLKSEEDFNELCKQLDKETDWPFFGSRENYSKLRKLLNNNIKLKATRP